MDQKTLHAISVACTVIGGVIGIIGGLAGNAEQCKATEERVNELVSNKEQA